MMNVKLSRVNVGIFAAALVLTAGFVFASGLAESRSSKVAEQAEHVAQEPEIPQPSRAEVVISALALAYADRVETYELRGGDWALLIDDVWYYYAGGRLLPEEMLENAEDYSPINFYNNYQSELPPWGQLPQRGQSNRGGGERSSSPRRQRAYFFYEALWNTRSSSEAAKQVKTIKFLGHTPTVHSGIVQALSQVEKRITEGAENDPQIKAWVTSIGEMHGWNWRNVPSSQNRSYHSYGVALDILPQSLGGKETYWYWAAQRGKSWWEIPYEDRYHPPEAVIKAFEACGFIWGGKWVSYFDTMHFEYRPEVFLINGLELPILQNTADEK